MAEDIKLMKGNEAIAHAAMPSHMLQSVTEQMAILDIPSLPNQKFWKLLWLKSLGKQQVWLYCRLKAKLQQ